jgi:hypothetical protein
MSAFGIKINIAVNGSVKLASVELDGIDCQKSSVGGGLQVPLTEGLEKRKRTIMIRVRECARRTIELTSDPLLRVLALALLASLFGIFVALNKNQKALMEFLAVNFLALLILFTLGGSKRRRLP